MNYCQKEEHLSKKVPRDLGDCYQYFYGAHDSTIITQLQNEFKANDLIYFTILFLKILKLLKFLML